MEKQPTFEVVLEVEPERVRPHFIPNGMTHMSWVGDWHADEQALVEHVAQEFEAWFLQREAFVPPQE
jgi:hypothetical protein